MIFIKICISVLIERMVKDEEVDSEVDGILGHNVAMFASLVYDGEMYLRPLYLLFKRNGLEKMETDEWSLSKYVGSRQQCMYACVCFIITFFAVYDNVYWCV